MSAIESSASGSCNSGLSSRNMEQIEQVSTAVADHPQVGTSEREPTEGAQSIKRAAAVLRLLAFSGRSLSVGEVTQASGLHKATGHRILRVLLDEGLVAQDPHSRRYRLGVEIFAMTAAMGERFDLKTIARPSLERL